MGFVCRVLVTTRAEQRGINVNASQHPEPAIRHDLGGWISGPALAPHPVPPGSSALRALAHAIDRALTLPNPATEKNEIVYLRCIRGRARLVRQAMRKVI